MKPILYVSLVSSMLLTGCAHVTFYKDEKLKEETGLKFYEAKPYILVVNKGKDQIDTQVIFLPDKTKPQYAVYHSGLGSHEFSINLANSILTSYGQKTDSKVPELIQAMTGLLSEGVKTAEKAGTFAAQGTPNYAALAQEVKGIADDLVNGLSGIALPDPEKALDKIQKVNKTLVDTATLLNLPTVDTKVVLQNLKSAKDDLNPLPKPLPDKFDPTSPQARYNALLATTTKRIDAVITAIKGEPGPTPSFELYEITGLDSNAPKLRKVE